MQVMSEDIVLVGQVSGLFGVKGWVKVYSYTEPRENIVKYSPWLLKTDKGWTEIKLVQGKRQGKGVIASLQGYADPDSSSRLIGCNIGLRRDQLPELGSDEYYWNDLIGLQVINQDGFELGRVERLIETGSNDVLVLQGDRERLVPYIKGQVIKHIDLDQKIIQVDWDPDF
jgi:16S rRNA processing protein RimM